ncbi:MAG: hypothetical protein A2268_12905 [Candidatus Raymondbacteria bacterium RifOxyA12_full_50_37]|nr:MAG: hypothetical protein A2268_12905 [Candidatus Raymondbacteria bacterium RifOxyA12_full_50_37]OGJ86721.1 MAG: hypothetical protein A2248_17505 [Candidatus Raymondbacteria bacterium RIFOXYA2_FULL_49_16]OGJ96453.1 MAG: hypothetical protein A2453_09255 [Candidatus Raymondbacteria bacterium RIFOXYC2_FULL_50_21]OGP40316.1 MAG: hypothetical protein A2324_12610 [Candidatus Raymondbacteria bacterium RIFOXYB2_FULL_49_35]
MLLIKPDPPYIRWCLTENGNCVEKKCAFKDNWRERIAIDIANAKQLTAIAYLLYHGGDDISEPASRLTVKTLEQVKRAVKLFPESNQIIYRSASYLRTRIAGSDHVLLCDTAFFNSLPAAAGFYALSSGLREKGMRRFGGFGLFHEWVWSQVRTRLTKKKKRLVSIYLGSHPNIAAIKDGKPYETTIGFTPVEGIPSITGCGDIDPTILFQLQSIGMSLREINTLFTRDSGYRGLLGKKCAMIDIIKDGAAGNVSMVRRMLRYHIVRYAGAFIAALGGIDAFAFLTEHPGETSQFIGEVLNDFNFLNVKWSPVRGGAIPFRDMTGAGSAAKIYCIGCYDWKIMQDHVVSFLNKGD